MSAAFPPDEARVQPALSSRMDFYEVMREVLPNESPIPTLSHCLSQVLRRIGKGSYGSVYLGRERSNHRKQ